MQEMDDNQLFIFYLKQLYIIELKDAWQINQLVNLERAPVCEQYLIPTFDPIKRPYLIIPKEAEGTIILVNALTNERKILVKAANCRDCNFIESGTGYDMHFLTS